MDISIAKQLFHTLYDQVDGYSISAKARNAIPVPNKSYIYGEIVPDSFFEYVTRAKPKPGEVFYDLGSGTGKAIILAAMLFDFSRCIGIEIISELYQKSRDIQARFNYEVKPHVSYPSGNIAFVNESFLDADFSDGDIFFCHSTCFSDDLMSQLVQKLEHIKNGSRIITVTKTVDSPCFIRLYSDDYLFGWGKATVHCYEKVSVL